MNIPAELRALLQIPNDPAAFVLAMFRTFFAPLRTIHNRVVQRTGIASVEIADSDPKRAGNQRARITMRDTGSDPGRLAARVAIMIVQKGKGSLYVDEAVRWASGQPVGTARSLDDDGAPQTLRSLDRRLMGARTLDPITLTLIVGVAVPLLVAVIPGLLPMIIEWGRSAFTAIVSPPSGGPPVPVGPAVPDAEREFGVGAITAPFADVFDGFTGGPGDGDPSNDTTNALIVGVVVVGAIYLLTRK